MTNNTETHVHELIVHELTISRYKNKSGATTKINFKNNDMSHSTLKCQCRKRMWAVLFHFSTLVCILRANSKLKCQSTWLWKVWEKPDASWEVMRVKAFLEAVALSRVSPDNFRRHQSGAATLVSVHYASVRATCSVKCLRVCVCTRARVCVVVWASVCQWCVCVWGGGGGSRGGGRLCLKKKMQKFRNGSSKTEAWMSSVNVELEEQYL